MEKTYEIGGTIYRQRRLVWGQVEQLLALVEGIKLRSAEPLAIMAAFGPKITEAVAVVLVPANQTPKEKTRDIPALADELRFDLENETIIEVIEDFFACNPIASLWERVSGALEKVMPAKPTAASSPSASASSPAAT